MYSISTVLSQYYSVFDNYILSHEIWTVILNFVFFFVFENFENDLKFLCLFLYSQRLQFIITPSPDWGPQRTWDDEMHKPEANNGFDSTLL